MSHSIRNNIALHCTLQLSLQDLSNTANTYLHIVAAHSMLGVVRRLLSEWSLGSICSHADMTPGIVLLAQGYV